MNSKLSVLFATLLTLLVAGASFAAVPRQVVVPKKTTKFLRKGFVIGGETQGLTSLLAWRRTAAKTGKLERWGFDFGDKQKRPLKERISYFHAEVQGARGRVTLTSPQMQTTEITPQYIAQKVLGSPLVKSVDMTYDPEDVSMNLQIQFKRPVALRATELPPKGEKSSRLVLDFKALR